jgi:adenylate cyclase
MAKAREGTLQSWEAALELFGRAVELDSEFPTPYAMVARTHAMLRQSGRIIDRQWEESEVRRLALRVSVIGRDDASALVWAGHAVGYMCREYTMAEALVDQGLSINPNLAVGWQLKGLVSLWIGQHEAAIEQIGRATRLNPRDPEAFRSEVVMASALLLLGRYDEATGWAARALAHQPYAASALWVSVSSNALAGNLIVAREIVARFLERHPAASISQFRSDTGIRRPQDVEAIVDGLRRAGLPE